jgi:hypothetical protein
VDEISTANLEARIQEAISRTARVKAFLNRFPAVEAAPANLLPAISWEQIERQLRSLAGPDFARASWELEVLKASARTSPAEMFYRELLTLAWSLIDDTRPLQTEASSPTEADMD